jgi:uncharacterized membrane protein YgcG
MSDEQPVSDETPTASTAVQAPETAAYEPIEKQDEWLDESSELPRRLRRRLLTPIPIALLAVLAIACGFIAGVLVEKGQSSSSSAGAAGASLASRFAALRGGTAKSGTGATGGTSTTGGSAGTGTGTGTGGGGATAGQVAYISGDTLYVTTTEGNTVKVTTSPGSTVTKTVKASVKGIHPGETVVVTGAPSANGAITAESIRVGTTGASALGGLFGGSRSGSGAGSAGGGSSSAGGSEPALFGRGG